MPEDCQRGGILHEGLTSLTSVTMPEGVIGIGNYALRSTGIESIVLPSTLSSMGSHVFRESDLTTISIPDGIVEIGPHAFRDCDRLESISIPESVTTLGINAFDGCTSLEAITIPGDLTSIPSSAFYGCSSLTTVNLPDTVTSIGNSALYGCTSLASIDLPVSLESIGSNAFQGCSILESITIPDTVTNIGRFAFNGCPSTMGIYFDGNAPSVDDKLSNTAAITAWWYEGKTGFNDGPWMGITGRMISPPGPPAALTLLPHYGGVGLTWEAPDYNGGFDPYEYEVLVGAIVKDTVTGTSAELSLDPGSYSISVRAISQIGTGDEASATINLNRDLAIIIPTTADTLRPGDVSIEWSYAENEDIIDRFELYIDGNFEEDFDTETTTHDVLLKVGVYVVEIRAFDGLGGHISAQVSIDVNADYEDGAYQYTLSGDMGDGPAIITGYSGLGGEVIVPDTLGGQPVEKIATSAFQGNEDITRVFIPATVEDIGNGAFSACDSLTDVIFLGDAPDVSGDLLSGDSDLRAWYVQGASKFTSPNWAGVRCEVLVPATPFQNLVLKPLYGGVELSWEAPVDSGSPVYDGYVVFVDGNVVNDAIHLTDSSCRVILGAAEYSISVAAGNEYNYGEEASATIDLSYALEITSPAVEDLLRPGPVTIEWSYSESSDIIERFQLVFDGVEIDLGSSLRSHEVPLAVGSRDVRIIAYDANDNAVDDQRVYLIIADYDDGTYQYTLSGDFGDGPAIITGYSGTGGEVIVPGTLGGQPVEVIAAGAFCGNLEIVVLVIPASVKTIGEEAFSGCDAVENIFFEGNAPAVGNDILAVGSSMTAWYYEGAEGFDSPTWMGVECIMLIHMSAPQDLTLTPFYGGIDITWSAPASSGVPEFEGYVLFVNGEQEAVLTETSLRLLLEQGVYSIDVRAYSKFGQGPAASHVIDFSYGLTIVSHTKFDILRPVTISIKWNYSEGAAIADHLLVIVDGVETQLGSDASSFDILKPVGGYDFEIRAVDIHGNSISDELFLFIRADYDTGIYQYTMSGEYGNGPAIITGYTGPGGEVTIPSTLGGKSVATIADDAFRGNAEITKITIPDSVKVVGDGAFADCLALESVHIGNGLEQMGAGVFDGDISLRSITFDGDAPPVDGDLLSDEEGFTVFYYEGAEGFASVWAGAPTEMISPEGELSPLLIAGAAVAALGLVAAVGYTVLRRRKAAKPSDVDGGEGAEDEVEE